MTQESLTFVPWESFLSHWKWKQGEHVTLLGPTGVGKTTLALELLPRRNFVVVFGTKPRDPTLQKLTKKGYEIIRKWPPPSNKMNRVILWPHNKELGDDAVQQRVFFECLKSIYREGGWTVYVDEIEYITEELKLQRPLKRLWQQGRSINLTVVGGNQRPAWIPLAAYSEATHLFIWRNPDEQNLDRLKQLASFNSKLIEVEAKKLGPHEVLYVHTREGTIIKTKVERSM